MIMNPQTRLNANLSGQKNHGLSCGFFSFWTFFWQKKRTLPPWKRFLKNSKKRHTYGISGDLWPLKLAFARVCVFIPSLALSKVGSDSWMLVPIMNRQTRRNANLSGHGADKKITDFLAVFSHFGHFFFDNKKKTHALPPWFDDFWKTQKNVILMGFLVIFGSKNVQNLGDELWSHKRGTQSQVEG